MGPTPRRTGRTAYGHEAVARVSYLVAPVGLSQCVLWAPVRRWPVKTAPTTRGTRLRLDVDRQRRDDAMRLHLSLDLGRRCGCDRRQELDHADVGGDGDVRASVLRDVVGHVAAACSLDRRCALCLAFQPAVDVLDGMGDDDL